MAAALTTAACSREPPEPPPPMPFDTAAVAVLGGADRGDLVVEVARTRGQWTWGLSRRPSLDPDAGMLFVSDSQRAADEGFWMWRTQVPLDIAFLDSTGVIVRVLSMEPCRALYPEGCPEYAPGVPYVSALETNRGWFGARDLGVGDTVRVNPDP